MKIRFENARRINHGRDGFDFLFFYKIDEQRVTHKIHAVTESDGVELAWHISPEDEYEYCERVFKIVIDFVKSYWEEFKKLPDENYEYVENRELKKLGKDKVSWVDYLLELA